MDNSRAYTCAGAHIALFLSGRNGIAAVWEGLCFKNNDGRYAISGDDCPYAVEVSAVGFFATDAEMDRNGIRYTPMRYQGPENDPYVFHIKTFGAAKNKVKTGKTENFS